MEHGAEVDYNDPYVPFTKKMRKYDLKKTSVSLTVETIKQYDCVLISTDHSSYDYEFIVKNSKLVVDARNATKNIKHDGNVVRA
jgi:UDP-N-acetyl-D-glucosamine dehydrogenase